MSRKVAKFRDIPEESMARLVRENDVTPIAPWELEICFFVLDGSFIRKRGNRSERVYSEISQMTFRCGMCAAPLGADELMAHFHTHEAAR